MIRTVISLDPEDKAWLDKRAKASGVPMTELVRKAIRQMRQADEGQSLDTLLEQTSGIWRRGDALKYQQDIRAEWP